MSGRLDSAGGCGLTAAMEAGLFLLVLIALFVVLTRVMPRGAGAAQRHAGPIARAAVDRAAVDRAAAQVLAELEQEAEEDASIEAFKAGLTPCPVPELAGARLTLRYGGPDEPQRAVELRALLVGTSDFYLDCWWPERGDSRLFAGRRVAELIDAQGRRHANVLDWIAASGPTGRRIAAGADPL